MDFMDTFFGDNGYITKLGDYMGSDTGKGLTNLAGMGLAGYGLYQANKAQDFNQSQISRDNAIQDTNTDAMTSAYSNVFNKKKNQLGTYTA